MIDVADLTDDERALVVMIRRARRLRAQHQDARVAMKAAKGLGHHAELNDRHQRLAAEVLRATNQIATTTSHLTKPPPQETHQ